MEVGLVKQIDIDSEMRDSYLSYAMSVIVSRALPDARDGLKPVQRRILYAMHDMGLLPTNQHRKSARVVGEVLGKYHPHGDQSVYDAMVRMAQDFSLRYMLVDGQGNFGSIDGDGAAAMRYTEVRMQLVGRDMLLDIDKNTVDFGSNFDDSLKEPLVLPASIPNLLVNGSAGIAVGMATSIPPHNLGEVVDALDYMLTNWERLDEITVSDLMKFIEGPDFPTGGLVFRSREGKDGKEMDALAAAYGSGRGKVMVRAKAHVEQLARNKSRIVITELPYQANKTNLLNRIAELHRNGKLEGLTDLRDESDRNGMRIILETTRTVDPRDTLAELFRLTPLQSTFSINLVALVDDEPRVLTLKQALRVYLDHRLEIVRRRAEYELDRARQRAHILEGLIKALDNLDAVIDTIRRSRNTETAQQNLMKQFKLSEIQARAILDMQLRRLAGLERKKIQDEYKEKLKLIKDLEKLLGSPELMRAAVKEELLAVKAQYGDTRRTQIVSKTGTEVVSTTDLIPDENVWVMVGQDGTVARTTSASMINIPAKPDEQPLKLLQANTQDIIYFFGADGMAASLPVYQLPQARGLGEGTHYGQLTPLSRKQHLATALVIPQEVEGYLTLATVGGVVKRVRLEDLPGLMGDAFTVIRVEENDSLGWAQISSGEDEIVLVTAAGQAIRFKEDSVRPMGLPAGGVMGIKLGDELDGVIAMSLASAGDYLWTITDNGMAKATPLDEYPVQGRHGQGVRNLNLPKEAEEVAAAVVGRENDELIINMSTGASRKRRLDEAKIGSRAVKPKALVPVGARTRVTGVVRWLARPDVPKLSGDEAEEKAEQLALFAETEAKKKQKKKA
ncbi:MAG: DNA gyrase subunit A [Anaerolineales bacterium]|nr:DNA gyrase subunit A [Anaerolineales bacterium]